jgi:hypothetical protein
MKITFVYLSALLEDITVSLVVVAGGARLAVHVGHVERGDVELEGGHAGAALPRLLAAQLTGLRMRNKDNLNTVFRISGGCPRPAPCSTALRPAHAQQRQYEYSVPYQADQDNFEPDPN